MTDQQKATSAELAKAVHWLQRKVVADARGDDCSTSDKQPSSLFWLGRLAPEADIAKADDDRQERLAPCAVGLRLRPHGKGPWVFEVQAFMRSWSKAGKTADWAKSPQVAVQGTISSEAGQTSQRFLEKELRAALREASGRNDLSAVFEVTVEQRAGQDELVVLLVNTSEGSGKSDTDRNLYEVSFRVRGLSTDPFQLDGLPDAFRYDRELPAIGLNCAVRQDGEYLNTDDVPEAPRPRPVFVPPGLDEALLSFEALAKDPLMTAEALYEAHRQWGQLHWADSVLSGRASKENWSTEMRSAAARGAEAFAEENERLARGYQLLVSDHGLRRAFCLMNEAMVISARGKYSGWRAFQLGFLLANLSCLTDQADTEIVDIVWFATGGGKTETYLGLLVTAMLHDRMRGKESGITAWSRFPLRMLSLQQTQRFADAIAAAELTRRKYGIGGDSFSLGFFVGQGATPNAISPEPKDGDPSPYEEETLRRFKVLDKCPFCREPGVSISFDLKTWTLRHECGSEACPWTERALPFYVVDEEIYRFLPTVVVGTLDKAASIGMQAAMRGFVGSPLGRCTQPGHGFTYAPRSKRPQGCLVPDCKHKVEPVVCGEELFAPTLRLQDELHLLRDSLGAVDAHYEALYDHLSQRLSGRRPKILGSSATLAGYERQVRTLYLRAARVFPQPGPAPGLGFWSSDGKDLMRHYIALAPRGVTVEHAVDRILTVLQRSIRGLAADPVSVCADIGVPSSLAPQIVDLYGTDVVYGNTLRDLDALSRSAETQILVEGPVNQRSLTGRSPFEEVRKTLDDLEKPAEAFDDRVHVVMASSMMSHGVDIDRLNVMAMVGFPLGTAEFIQATARVGRRYPGLVILIPKMGRERDAGIYRTFPKFVEHSDRLVDPIPITRRSRRVLQRTLPGLELGRILMLEEPVAGKALTLPRALHKYRTGSQFDPDVEVSEIVDALGLTGPLDDALRKDIANWLDVFQRNVADPPADVIFTGQASPGQGPMRSLRDVEEAVPIYGKEDSL
ncbi:hypothetical protein GCM10008101_27780 [Lysobacter xinjiangensis]|uniref:Helicase C-terminal domain-containing protein n=1 Tax=Cognatilysobacter xinjiangensis TaxID=546892 RepID=A0ABQ3C7S5_9GAMM|nr:helicase C-terminal domain-containing protein [Lysobacter xinjiangensis]GGZ71991.1 hypothetical protein GCM10008101_27780 [Lysobacter xinjiangensis]